MRLVLWLSCFLAAVNAQRRCGTSPPTLEQRTSVKHGGHARIGRVNAAPIVIPTYIHIFAFNETFEGGWVSEDDLNAQVQVMQADFAPHNISFEIKGVNCIINPVWASGEDIEGAMNASYTGTYDTLNFYFVADLGGTLGFTSLPGSFPPGSDQFFLDAAVVVTTSIPGGTYELFNLGKTATHDISHWLFLYHTFEDMDPLQGEFGGCTPEGDLVSDTPASANGTMGCPIGRDSCRDMEGLDPIHNFMDYSDDACMFEFTEGQTQRMHAGWQSRLRAIGKGKC